MAIVLRLGEQIALRAAAAPADTVRIRPTPRHRIHHQAILAAATPADELAVEVHAVVPPDRVGRQHRLRLLTPSPRCER